MAMYFVLQIKAADTFEILFKSDANVTQKFDVNPLLLLVNRTNGKS